MRVAQKQTHVKKKLNGKDRKDEEVDEIVMKMMDLPKTIEDDEDVPNYSGMATNYT